MLPRLTAVRQDDGVFAARIFKGVAQDRQTVEGSFIVDGLSALRNSSIVPLEPGGACAGNCVCVSSRNAMHLLLAAQGVISLRFHCVQSIRTKTASVPRHLLIALPQEAKGDMQDYHNNLAPFSSSSLRDDLAGDVA
jgi:hypothetical protein